MQHPDPERIRSAMNLLSEYEEGRRTVLEMMAPTAGKTALCGTVACFAGHFHVADRRRRRKKVKWSDAFINGAEDFTRHVFGGARSIECLCRWADANSNLWGNEQGLNLFYSGRAYGPDHYPATLRDVIDHWLAVADRIEAHNAAS